MNNADSQPFIAPPCHEPLQEIYRDNHIVVVNKPAGLLSVPGRHEANRDSVLSRLQQIELETRVVHRLDMATSGLMILGLNADSHRHLSRQFQDRKVSKEYTADIWGHPEQQQGEIKLPLRCDWPNRPKQMVDFELGKSAHTRFRVISHTRNSTRVSLEPVTGRSHQLRVHMAEMGHPILGCPFYAHPEACAAADRLHLHATSLSLTHPVTGQEINFSCPAPF
ncbi:pseudouridine synthase [Endozoicomonadaceae bacterium StTr2]